MNAEQYLLICLAEEAAELSHAALKAARFGLDDQFHPEPERRPRALLLSELYDLMAVTALLEEAGYLITDQQVMESATEAKIAKVKHFMEYSKQRGRLI